MSDNWLEERVKGNIQALQNLYPELAPHLDISALDFDRLVAHDDGDWNLKKSDGSLLYQQGAQKDAPLQVNALVQRLGTNRILLNPPHVSGFEDDPRCQKFMETFLGHVSAGGVQFFSDRCDNSAVSVVSYGCGLAEHLEPMMDRFEVQSLSVVEPNVEFFQYSLVTFDWAGFLQRTLARHRKVHLVIGQPRHKGLGMLRTYLQENWGTFADGTVFFKLYNDEELDGFVTDFVAQHVPHLCSGFGFLDDELAMIRNSVGNLQGHKRVSILRDNRTANDVPFFIVGSGPSIDQTIEYVKQHSGQAVVLSCGTAIELLLKNGIKPDFHIELENVPEVYDALSRCNEKHSIADIHLIASNTIDPRVSTLFKKTSYFIRDGVVSYSFFALNPGTFINTPANAFPLVSNTAMSVARVLGGRKMYFFGVDMGTKDTSQHHSKHSAYTRGELDYPFQNDIEREGNFGGKVYCNQYYVMSISIKEIEIAATKGQIKYYNCSDGAKVIGMEPMQAKDIQLNPLAMRKGQVVRELTKHFDVYTEKKFLERWENAGHLDRLNRFEEMILAHFDKSTDSYVDLMKLMITLMKVLTAPSILERSIEQSIFKSAMAHPVVVAYYYMVRIGDPAQREFYAKEAKQALRSQFETSVAELRGVYEELGLEQ